MGSDAREPRRRLRAGGRHRHLAALIGVILALPIASNGMARAAERAALVVGNSAYTALPSLANPRSDAAAVADRLAAAGFAVTRVVDADGPALRRNLERFAADARDADVALFFYAGHGVQINGENHLLPVSVQPTDAGSILEESITLAQVRGALQAAAPDLLVLVLDSCRENPFGAIATAATAESGAPLEIEAGLAQAEGGIGLLIAYATQPGQVAWDGAGRHSPFTDALLDHLTTPGLDIRLMFGRVREQVVAQTRGLQIPWVEEAVLGEAYLAGVLPEAVPAEGEEAVWRRIRRSEDPSDFRSFLASYPDGLFAELARNRLSALDEVRPAAAGGPSLGALDGDEVRRLKNALYWLGFYGGDLGPQVGQDLAAAVAAFGDRLGLEPGRSLGTVERRQIDFAAAAALIGLGERLAERIAFDSDRLAAIDRAVETVALPALADLRAQLPADDPGLVEAERQVAEMRDRRAALAARLETAKADYLTAVTAAGAGYPDLLPTARGAGAATRGLGNSVPRREAFIRHALDYAERGEIDEDFWIQELL